MKIIYFRLCTEQYNTVKTRLAIIYTQSVVSRKANAVLNSGTGKEWAVYCATRQKETNFKIKFQTTREDYGYGLGFGGGPGTNA
jgi:hypothetical protein